MSHRRVHCAAGGDDVAPGAPSFDREWSTPSNGTFQADNAVAYSAHGPLVRDWTDLAMTPSFDAIVHQATMHVTEYGMSDDTDRLRG